MGKYFGTDGFRGEANVGLNVEHAFKVGRFLGWYYSKEAKPARVVIGKDTRRSSYMFEYALAAGLTSSGADAYLLHVTTTPSVAYIVRTEDFDLGIMISASHNPFHDNGIKIVNKDGHKLEADVENKIEEYIDGLIPEIPFATGLNIGRTVDYFVGRNRYTAFLMNLASSSLEGKRIGLDCANGSAFTIAKSVFDALGAKTYVINNEPDGSNINNNCGSTHIEGLQNFVIKEGLDVGFAYDGDADRCLCVDENGKVVDGDGILYMCGRFMHEKGVLTNDTVVTTVMSNMGLYKAFDELGIKYEQTQVGDKYVCENMMANGHCIGGEQSGHIIFSKHASTGDGILTSLKIMEVMIQKKLPISALMNGFTVYPQVLKNVRVTDKSVVLEDADIKKVADEVSNTLGDEGRLLLRPSGTEPLIRVMVEAKTKEICEEMVEKVVKAIEDKGFAVK